MELTLERRNQSDKTANIGVAAITPVVSEDYWAYRVRLSGDQAVVGFPKFNTVGIGFAQEEDWNTNLPYGIRTVDIVSHICHNAGPEITVEQMCEAVELVRKAVYEDFPDKELPDYSGWEPSGVVAYDLDEAQRLVSNKLADEN